MFKKIRPKVTVRQPVAYKPNAPRPRPKFIIGEMQLFVMYFLTLVLLACVGLMAFKVYQLAHERIPKPQLIMNIQNLTHNIPLGSQDIAVRIQTLYGSGSGIIVSKHSILTNAHVLTKMSVGEEVFVQEDVDSRLIKASILHIDEKRDLALIQTAKELSKIAQFQTTIKYGQGIVVIGSPQGQTDFPTYGYFYRYSGDTIIVSCNIYPGNSGGPIIDAKTGKVVGIARNMSSPMMTDYGPLWATHIAGGISSTAILEYLKTNLKDK
jgi:S1-C subfamily serine protease